MIRKFKSKFSVPYNEGFAETLNTYSDYINDFYFSDDTYPSARVKSTRIKSLQKDIKLSKELGVKSNYLLNSAFYESSLYTPSNLKRLAEHINSLGVEMLTINNMFLLQSRDFMDELDSNIIIKNSVNNKIDSVEKAAVLIKKFGIKDLIIDRSINRDTETLRKILKYCRENNVTSTIMVNEGCMPNCMYKQFCDLGTSIFNTETDVLTERNKDTQGCALDYKTDPDLVLKSPFITRPNLLKIIDEVDVVKIAGRNISSTFVAGVLDYFLLNNRSLTLYDFASTKLPRFFKRINFYMLEEYDYSSYTENCKSLCFSECNQCNKIVESIINTKI